ncbi:DUF1080 domain-containing protein [Candidatus Poribacteria bacterium]|nr:DUF1080 domain-containing protein [Candidatus Poribacteria bacterium]
MLNSAKMILLVCILMIFVCGSVYSGTFFDDFENPNDFWVVGMGEWAIEGGVYHQTDTTSNGARGLFSYLEGSENWGDNFTIEVMVNIITSGVESQLEAGIMYKWQDKDNQYHVVLDNNDSIVRINNCFNGNWQANQNMPFAFGLDEWHSIKVVVENNEHEIYIDDDLIKEYARDVDDKVGFIGLKTLGCEASFDDFRVTGPGVPDSGVNSPVEYAGKLASTWSSIKIY